MAQNQLNFKINFDVNQSGIVQAKKSLEQLRNISKRDLEIVYHVDSSQVDRTFNEITRQSNIMEEALENAFNPRLNVINFQRFNQELQNSGTSINQIRGLCQSLGDVGNKAFTEMTVGITDVKYQTVQTTTLLDKMAASLRRNLTVFVSMNIINKVKGSINEAYGYVKNLDTSLNEIRIVTGKSADEMDRFAESANKAAAKFGKATTDYTKASTIFYQQGLSDEEVQARTEVTLKASNTTGEDTKKVADQLTSMWNGFNVGAEDAEKAVDVVAAVAKTTASNLDEMATAMSKVASLANSMGVSEEQLASQISTVISVTRQAPESVGTALTLSA